MSHISILHIDLQISRIKQRYLQHKRRRCFFVHSYGTQAAPDHAAVPPCLDRRFAYSSALKQIRVRDHVASAYHFCELYHRLGAGDFLRPLPDRSRVPAASTGRRL